MIDAVVNWEWTRAHDVVLLDVRWYLDGRSGHDAYMAGHLPGARYVELDTTLAGPPSAALGRHPLPDPDAFAAGLREVGVNDDSIVVAYDDAGGVIAARLVWLLRLLGHDAALLDGGLSVVTERATDEPAVVLGTFMARPWPTQWLATIDELADGDVVIDARPRERFLGLTPDPVDARAGHVPGARSVPCREHLNARGFLRDADELRAVFATHGISEGTPVISYCGSGVTACHNLLVLEFLGLGKGRLFPGSWSQYSADASRPVAVGE